MDANDSCTITAVPRSGESQASTASPSPTPQSPVKRRAGRPRGPARPREEIAAAIKAYTAGELMDDIAARFGVSQPTVSYWVAKYGEEHGGEKLPRRRQGRRAEKHPNPRDTAILFRAINGHSLASIGREYGLSRARVAYIVKTWEGRGFVARPPHASVEQAGDLPALAIQPNQPFQP